MIDPATGWFEIHQYDDKKSITIANIGEQEWFSRYPWPTQVTFYRGKEFIGHDFQDAFAVRSTYHTTLQNLLDSWFLGEI